MKATIPILAMMLMFSSAVYADDISEERAKEIAMEFLDGGSAAMTRSASAAQMKLSRIVQTEEGRSPELYIFNRGNDEGWVIVAGDDSAPSRVFAYSDTGSYDYDKASDVSKMFLDSYAKKVSYYRTNKSAAPLKTREIINTPTKIGPLLKTTWDQTTPYNNMCPVASNGGMEGYGGRCPTGCVATAMAQILNYWQWPKQGWGFHTNESNSTQTVNFSQSIYDWDNMLDSYSGDYTEAQGNAVAKLMADVGCATNMTYNDGSSGTTTNEVFMALFLYFGYSTESIKFYGDIMYPYAINYQHRYMIDNIKKEIDAGRPVIAGADNRVPFSVDHVIVVDGYDENGWFHYNMGWGGKDDGFYDEYAEENIRKYTQIYEYITGIQPPKANLRIDNIGYELTDNNEVCVCSGPSEGGKAIIKESVEFDGQSYPVTSIFPQAFWGMENITEAYFPGTIKKIPAHLLESGLNHNTALKKVTFAEGVEEIGDSAFRYNENLSSILTLPSTIKYIGHYAFGGSGIEWVKAKGAKDFIIGTSNFSNCNDFEGIENAAEIYPFAIGVTNPLTMPFTVQPTCKYHDRSVYANKVIIPATANVGPGCVIATDIYEVDKGNPNLTSLNGVLFSKDRTQMYDIPTNYVKPSFIPNGVKKVYKNAFPRKPQNTYLPPSVEEVETIRGSTVYVMSSIPPIIDEFFFPGPDQVLKVPVGSKGAYEQADGWKNYNTIKEEIVFDGTLYYEIKTFMSDTWAIVLGRDLSRPFDGHVMIPESVSFEGKDIPVWEIKYYSFSYDDQIQQVSIPSKVSEASLGLIFYGSKNIHTINVSENNTDYHITDGMLIYEWDPNRYQLTYCPPMKKVGNTIMPNDEVVIPDEVFEIMNYAFCDNLRKVTFPSADHKYNRYIRLNSFEHCADLKEIYCSGVKPPLFDYNSGGWGSNYFHPNVFLPEHGTVVYVPLGYKDTYLSRSPFGNDWNEFPKIREFDPVTGEVIGGEDPEPTPPDNPTVDDDPNNAVAVYRNNGQVEYFSFAGRPKLTYRDKCLVMQYGNSYVQYTLKGLVKITFCADPTDVEDGPMMDGLKFSFDNDEIRIASAKAGHPVRLYNLKGQCVKMLSVDGNGNVTVTLESLPPGVYIIQIEDITYKVLRK